MLIRISTKVLKSFTGTFHDIKIIVDPFFCRVNEKETTNTTTTDEFPISNKSNNHRGSCASTLNLTDEPSYEHPPVFENSDQHRDRNYGNTLQAPLHKSSKGHPYESKNTSF